MNGTCTIRVVGRDGQLLCERQEPVNLRYGSELVSGLPDGLVIHVIVDPPQKED